MTNADSNNNHSHSSQNCDNSRNSHSNHTSDKHTSSNHDHDHDNPFIRFRHHVDANLHAGLSTLMAASQRRGDSSTSTTNDPSPSSLPTQPTPTPISPSASTPTLTSTSTPTTPNPNPNPNPSSLLMTPTPDHHLPTAGGGASNTPAQAALAWRLFLTRSPYSPLRLEQEWYDGNGGLGGWRPVPKGVSREVAAQVGWLEAFEDLMRVSSGLGVVDFEGERSVQRWGGGLGLFGGFGGGFGPFHDRGVVASSRGWDSGWGWGWGMREVAWLERMHARGLTEVMFPVYDPGMGYQSPRTLAEWTERRRVEESREREAGRVWEELMGEGRRAVEREADAWVDEARREMKKEVDAWRDAAQETGSSFFDGIGGAVKTLGKVLEDEVKSLRRSAGEEDRKSQDRGAVQKDDAPQTESDLYSVIQSAFHESERSLSNFFKLISEGGRDHSLPEPKPVSPPKVKTTEAVEDGITKKTTTEEFVDQHGNTHSKTETTWTDENGHVIMKQVHSSMGRSEHWEKTTQGAPTEPDKAAAERPKEQQHPKESGWFWK